MLANPGWAGPTEPNNDDWADGHLDENCARADVVGPGLMYDQNCVVEKQPKTMCEFGGNPNEELMVLVFQ